jgi:hypothetical protein
MLCVAYRFLLLRRLRVISLGFLVGGAHVGEGPLLGREERLAAVGSTGLLRGRLRSLLLGFHRDRRAALVLRQRHVLVVLAFGVTLALARLVPRLGARWTALSRRRLVVAALAVFGIVPFIVKPGRDIGVAWRSGRFAVDAAGTR